MKGNPPITGTLPAPAGAAPAKRFNGWVLYDARCPFCKGMIRIFQGLLGRHYFSALPLQTPWVRERLGVSKTELLADMKLLTEEGKVFGGADALMEMARDFWWTWPIRALGRVPLVMNGYRRGYNWMARHRSCTKGACATRPEREPKKLTALDWLPLLILPVTALFFRGYVAPWVFMWAMSLALYAGCKWLTYREEVRRGAAQNAARMLGYLFAWPGMDANAFLDCKNVPVAPGTREWLLALIKTAFGAVLTCGAARLILPTSPLLAGWTGMVGLIFVLHFGSFHLMSLAWRRAGVNAAPLMQNPPLATSLSEFWGRRWNTAFNELAFRFTFRPVRRLISPALATLAVFGLSGLVHELVISLPAGGGYGLPTLYFLAQGGGVLAERSRLGRKIGLGSGWRGRTFALLVAAGPALWLFHPPFVRNVILPMLSAIGAT